MSRFKLLYFVIFIITLHILNAQISDKRLCVDKECSVPISHAKTLLRYSSPDSRILSFHPNVDITIYSKSAGSREDLWGGEIKGKRGYVPKHMVRETKVLQKPTLLVDTEFSNDTELKKEVPSQVEPNKVQEPYEVVDGTTIYLNPQDNISPSSTESPIETTALPAETNKMSENQVVSETLTSASPTSPEEQKLTEIKHNTPEIQEVESDNDQVDNNDLKEGEKEVDKDNTDDEQTISKASSENSNTNKIVENIDIPTATLEDGARNIENETNAEIKSDGTPQIVNLEETKGPIEAEAVQEENKSEDENQIPTSEEAAAEIKTEPAVTKTEGIKLNTESEITETPDSSNIGIKTENLDSIKSDSVTDEPKTVMDGISNTTVSSTQEIQEETKIENLDSMKSESVTEEPKTVVDGTLDSISSTQAIKEEAVKISPPETTTVSPEIEVPLPLDDFIQVTENPAHTVTEAPKINTEVPPTILPPLGLFAESKQESEPVDVTSQEILVDSNDTISENVDSEEESDSSEDSNIENAQQEDEIVDLNSSDSQEVDEPTEPEETKFENSVPAVDVSVDDQSITSEEKDLSEQNVEETSGPGFFDNIWSFFSSSPDEKAEQELTPGHIFSKSHVMGDEVLSASSEEPFCEATSCTGSESNETGMDFLNFSSDVFLYLVTTAISVIIFLFGYIALDKSKREGPLVAKINKLEKELMVLLKENQILQEKLASDSGYETNDKVSSEVVENLKQDLIEVTEKKNALEEQVQSLEKELENSTEVGMELNRMLTEILSSEGGGDVLKANVENLQRQLVEQQATINSVNETLAITNTENHELRLELEISNKKVLDLQAELDKLLLNILKIEEEKETQQSVLETEIANLRHKYDEINNKFKLKENDYTIEVKQLTSKLEQTERKLELKVKEYNLLSETVKQIKIFKNDSEALQNLLEVGEIKAELQLLKSENQRFAEKIQQEQDLKVNFEKRAQTAGEELQQLKRKYDEADKLKMETQTKLEVLSNYFKDREAQWQKEISKHEALWAEKEGEASSTTERIKFMQEQLQNYKAQTESLKQEIMSQEIELKSQISVLEKKAHENWVSARQAERKLEDAKQEAAQLRHRLTLRERAIQEDKTQHRLQSPIEQNGDMPESPASPPLLYGTRDHITKSPPLPGLPPFLPPPPGVPFMPPPMHGVPPFIPPPPPNMFPGDHRPPPLGRMSSPPLNSRYSPSSRGYSPYDRNSSSPSDSEYGISPPHRRDYSPFNSREDRRDYKRPPPMRSNGRNIMKGGSSGSGHSNESLEKISRQQSKV